MNTPIVEDGTYIAESDGAGGIQLKTKIYMGKGYWVSEPNGIELHGLTKETLIDALNLLDVEPGETIGVWTDEDNGLVYVDRSLHFIKEHIALQVAKAFDQFAIWDCKKENAIRVDGIKYPWES